MVYILVDYLKLDVILIFVEELLIQEKKKTIFFLKKKTPNVYKKLIMLPLKSLLFSANFKLNACTSPLNLSFACEQESNSFTFTKSLSFFKIN